MTNAIHRAYCRYYSVLQIFKSIHYMNPHFCNVFRTIMDIINPICSRDFWYHLPLDKQLSISYKMSKLLRPIKMRVLWVSCVLTKTLKSAMIRYMTLHGASAFYMTGYMSMSRILLARVLLVHVFNPTPLQILQLRCSWITATWKYITIDLLWTSYYLVLLKRMYPRDGETNYVETLSAWSAFYGGKPLVVGGFPSPSASKAECCWYIVVSLNKLLNNQ